MPVHTIGSFVRVKAGVAPNDSFKWADNPKPSSCGVKLTVTKYGAARDGVWVENEQGAEDVVPVWTLEPWDDKNVWHGGKWIAITPEMGLPTVDDGSLESKVGRLRDMVCGVNNCLDELRKAFTDQTKELECLKDQKAKVDKLLLEEKSKRGDAEIEFNKTIKRHVLDSKAIHEELSKANDNVTNVVSGYEAKVKQYEALIQAKNDDLIRQTAARNEAIDDRDYWKFIAIGCGFYIVSSVVVSIAWLIAR
jgi:hypothetical protein